VRAARHLRSSAQPGRQPDPPRFPPTFLQLPAAPAPAPQTPCDPWFHLGKYLTRLYEHVCMISQAPPPQPVLKETACNYGSPSYRSSLSRANRSVLNPRLFLRPVEIGR